MSTKIYPGLHLNKHVYKQSGIKYLCLCGYPIENHSHIQQEELMEEPDREVCEHNRPVNWECVDCTVGISGKIKEDKSQKPAISTLPVDSLYKIAMVFQWVIKQGKYKADDWRNGVSWKENYDSLQRHLMDYYKGQDSDKETGIETLAHAGCRLLMALEMQIKGTGKDDRFKEK